MHPSSTSRVAVSPADRPASPRRPAATALSLLLLALALALSLASGGDDDDGELQPLTRDAGSAFGSDAGGGAGVDAGAGDEPDAAVPWCGDGTCDPAEACDVCVEDCGACDPSCGDGVCAPEVECDTCPADCGTCITIICGDAVCSEQEDCGSCAHDCGPCDARGDLEDKLLALVNAMRLAGGDCPSGYRPPAPALSRELALRAAARAHVEDMAQNDYFSHYSQDGRTPWDRMAEAGYDGSPRGENLAAGYPDAESTFQQWVHSDGHCLTMMSAEANEGAIGYAHAASSTYRHYWALEVGWR